MSISLSRVRLPFPFSTIPFSLSLISSHLALAILLNTHSHPSLLSSDHFDDHVEASLRRSLPIITTPHAKSHLTAPAKTPEEAFTSVHDLDFYDDIMVDIASKKEKRPAIKVTGMPGKHVPPGPGGVVGKLNDLIAAVSFLSLSFYLRVLWED